MDIQYSWIYEHVDTTACLLIREFSNEIRRARCSVRVEEEELDVAWDSKKKREEKKKNLYSNEVHLVL